MTETATIAEMKGAALNEFARALATATTMEEAKGVSLMMVRRLLDIIYPEGPWEEITEAELLAGIDALKPPPHPTETEGRI